jgi:hypothetical protein
VGKEDAGAHQAQKSCHRLDHRKFPFCPMSRTERPRRCTVKRIPPQKRKWNLTDDFAQQFRQEMKDSEAITPQIDGLPSQPLIHYARALPISAVFALRYVNTLMRKWAHRGRAAAECLEVGVRPVKW